MLECITRCDLCNRKIKKPDMVVEMSAYHAKEYWQIDMCKKCRSVFIDALFTAKDSGLIKQVHTTKIIREE